MKYRDHTECKIAARTRISDEKFCISLKRATLKVVCDMLLFRSRIQTSTYLNSCFSPNKDVKEWEFNSVSNELDFKNKFPVD